MALLSCPLCLCGLLYWLDGNESSGSAFILELHDTGNLCEQRIVFADADIQTGLELRPSLANEDRTTRHELARKPLDSEPLGVTIAAVARTADSFFMRHDFSYTIMLS